MIVARTWKKWHQFHGLVISRSIDDNKMQEIYEWMQMLLVLLSLSVMRFTQLNVFGFFGEVIAVLMVLFFLESRKGSVGKEISLKKEKLFLVFYEPFASTIKTNRVGGCESIHNSTLSALESNLQFNNQQVAQQISRSLWTVYLLNKKKIYAK